MPGQQQRMIMRQSRLYRMLSAGRIRVRGSAYDPADPSHRDDLAAYWAGAAGVTQSTAREDVAVVSSRLRAARTPPDPDPAAADTPCDTDGVRDDTDGVRDDDDNGGDDPPPEAG